MREYLEILKTDTLSTDQACLCMKDFFEIASEEDQRNFLLFMNTRRATIDELVGFVLGMRPSANRIDPDVDVLDTCGTGGDNSGTFNISTAAALVAAAADVPIAKHGNTSITSKCGSANVLKELDFNIDMSPEACKQMIEDVNFAFLFAPNFYPVMRSVAPLRKEIGRTIFNQLGPLCNPANATAQLVGVYDELLGASFSHALYRLGVTRSLVVCSEGLDEISNIDETLIYEMNGGKVNFRVFKPEESGFSRATLEDIRGGEPRENAAYIRRIFDGEKGSMRDITILNAGAAIYLHGLYSFDDAFACAAEVIDSGAALRKLEEVVSYSKSA